MSTSPTMSVVATSVAINASIQAARASEVAEDALRLQCKATYQPEICEKVCIDTSRVRLDKEHFWNANYNQVITNQCLNTTEVASGGVQMTGNGYAVITVLIIFSVIFFIWLVDELTC